jgi:hypothetical protein
VKVTVASPTVYKTNIVNSGRISDPKIRERAKGLVDGGKSAESVARATLAAVDRGQLHSIPMADGRWFWRVKRALPSAFNSVAGRVGRRAGG